MIVKPKRSDYPVRIGLRIDAKMRDELEQLVEASRDGFVDPDFSTVTREALRRGIRELQAAILAPGSDL